MAYQLSEMKAKYKGQVDLTSNLTPHPKQLQTATLADHFVNGPTKVLVSRYIVSISRSSYMDCENLNALLRYFCQKKNYPT